MYDRKKTRKISEEKKRWEKTTLNRVLSRSPERLSRFSTVSDEEIAALYTPDLLESFDYGRELSFPGDYPYTRGVQPSMYRGRMWTMRQFAGYGSAEDTNARFKFLLAQGQTGLSTAFHFPTLMGYDSDSPRAKGEVGKCGVAVDSLKDMEILFDGIPLDKVTTSMTINGPAAMIFAMYLGVAEKQGVSFDRLGGTIQNDILKEYIAQHAWVFPPDPSMRIITDILGYCSDLVPKWNTISISGYHIREAGSTAVQELAFTIADGIAYVQAGVDAGIPVDKFAPRLSYFFNAHVDFFEEIAKYRAARRMWARIMKDRFKAKDENSWKLRFHTQTAGCTLTAQQPVNNVVRVALQALSAVLGGTQSLHTNSMDETLALPTEHAATIALRTQQIIAEESGVANSIDPLGGSFFLEKLTNEMEEKALNYIQKIDEMGGMVKAVKRGYPQREIADAAFHYQRLVDAGEKRIVGVNCYTKQEEIPIPLLKIDERVEKRQIERTREVRRKRSAKRVKSRIDALKDASLSNTNLMPLLLDAVKEYATLGEICDALRETMGTYTDPAMF
ncbi:MAG: methylmalonyl-CoA mutase [Deltaproteobacteria bacterium RBG_19FT_COMBO_60_16]|nr:MAG: methylmalonyl-CoA mutase [Deltaproteobacteria bacterium RBG_16_64_85]OGP99889.1 MAG: methylmalonyl-CoA mutase [Deltaproteobacteria bacterium RBG_19FT_COMBO_60_16]